MIADPAIQHHLSKDLNQWNIYELQHQLGVDGA
jgi:hypothetical protein